MVLPAPFCPTMASELPAALAPSGEDFQANQEAAREVAEWQKRMDDEARALEDTVKRKPDDVESRVKLLRHYTAMRDRPGARQARQAHVIWLVENQPGNPAARVYALLSPRQDGDAYSRVKALWEKQVAAHPEDRAIPFEFGDRPRLRVYQHGGFVAGTNPGHCIPPDL